MNKQLTDAQEAYRQLSGTLNGMNHSKALKEIVQMAEADDKETQQILFKLFMALVSMWALNYIKRRYTAKNKAACKYACDIKMIMENEDWHI